MVFADGGDRGRWGQVGDFGKRFEFREGSEFGRGRGEVGGSRFERENFGGGGRQVITRGADGGFEDEIIGDDLGFFGDGQGCGGGVLPWVDAQAYGAKGREAQPRRERADLERMDETLHGGQGNVAGDAGNDNRGTWGRDARRQDSRSKRRGER